MAATYTPNFGLKKPDPDDFYDVLDFNSNADILDANIVKGTNVSELVRGILAARPVPRVKGRYYFAQDAGAIYLDTGEAWVLAAASRGDITALQGDFAAHKADEVTDSDGVHGLKIEDGIFTPTLRFAFLDPTVTYSKQYGVYTKINKRVFFTACVVTSIWSHNGSVQGLILDSLPFALASGQDLALTGYITPFTKANYSQIIPMINPSVYSGQIYFMAIGTGQATGGITAADVPSGTNIYIYASGSYLTN